MNYTMTSEQLNDIRILAEGNTDLLDYLNALQCSYDVVCDSLSNPQKVVNFIRYRIGYEDTENFNVLYINARGNIIKCETLFKGGKTQSIVAIDEVLRRAILLKAHSIIVSHNHPSGNTTPSPQDLEITEKLKGACELVGIPLLDHVIVSKIDYFSFKKNGLI